jgi:WD40 repeat protein
VFREEAQKSGMLALLHRNNHKVELLSADDYSAVGILEVDCKVNDIRVSPDGSLMTVTDQKDVCKASVWDVQAQLKTVSLSLKHRVHGVFFIRGGSEIVTICSHDRDILFHVWSCAGGDWLQSALVQKDIYFPAVTAAQHPTEDVFIVGTESSTALVVLGVPEKKNIARLADFSVLCGEDDKAVVQIAFNASGKLAAVVCRNRSYKASLYIVNTETWQTLLSPERRLSWVRCALARLMRHYLHG